MTSGEKITAAITEALKEKAEEAGVELNLNNAPLLKLMLKAIGEGVYKELLQLDDITGQPPSVGHK